MAEEADNSNAAQSSDIAALPTRKLDGTQRLGEQNKCLICLDEFGEGDDVKTLPCLHIYHQKCVEQWLRTDNSCPVCKTPIGQMGS
jgi:E3 ubiquitin-protein ligase RNF115/126